MKKYYTPEIELEILSTSDICNISDLKQAFSDSGESPTVSWENNEYWK